MTILITDPELLVILLLHANHNITVVKELTMSIHDGAMAESARITCTDCDKDIIVIERLPFAHNLCTRTEWLVDEAEKQRILKEYAIE